MKKPFLLLLLFLLMICNSCQTSSFQGNENIIISDNYSGITSLEELINLPEFKDKVLFINVYSFYCKHSLDEFPYITKLQKAVQDSLKTAEDIVFIHLSTPKWTSPRTWRSNIEDHDLRGYHFLTNEKFEDEFWSHFPEEQRATPFFIEVTRDKKILKERRPSAMFQKAALDGFTLKTYKFVRENLDSILSEHPKEYDLLVKFDNSSEEKISFFTYSKDNTDNSEKVTVWKDLRVFTENSLNSIPDIEGLSTYSFAIPLNPKILDSVIPD